MFGFGGLGASFPMRYGAPTSNQVMSDDEWNADWQRRIDAIPRSISQSERVELVGSGYDPGKATRDYSLTPMGTVNRAADRFGVVLNDNGTIGMNPYDTRYQGTASHTIRNTWSEANPEYARQMRNWQDEGQRRGEVQTANQQAYDWMRGWGQENAIMGPDYSTPGFGRVDGNPKNPFAPTDGAGVDMSWLDGFYDPQSGQMTGVYAPGRQTMPQWGL